MAIGKKRKMKEEQKEMESEEEEQQHNDSYFYGDDDMVNDKSITSGLIGDAPQMPKSAEDRQKWKRLVVILEAATLHTLKKVSLLISF